MLILLFKLEPEDFYLLIAAIVFFIIGLASFISAIAVIYSKAWKPMRERFNKSFFEPLDNATSRISDFSTNISELSNRLGSLEETIKSFDLSNFSERLQEVLFDVAYLKFKLRRNTRRASEPIFVLNERMNCDFVNNALCEMLDADSSELENRNWIHFIVPEERAVVLKEWQLAYEENTMFEMVWTALIRGERKKLLIQAEPFIYEGKVRNYFGTASFITNQQA